MRFPPLSLLPLAVVLLALASCSKVNDMHDATMEMDSKTSTLSDTSNKMNSILGEIYDTGRQGAALDLRNKEFNLVLNSPKLEDKGLHAVNYFLSFEFQLWSTVGEDDKSGERERLMQDAACEFFARLDGITHWDEVDPFAGNNPFAFGAAENEKASFNALAASLERNNRKQEMVQAESGTKEISLLQMIETALLADQQIQAGQARLQDFPQYVDTIRSHEEVALRLLKARYQVLGLAVLARLTPIGKNLVEGFKYKVLGESWSVDLSQLNDSELNQLTYYLRQAVEARDFLKAMGVDEPLDPSLQRIFSHARLQGAPLELTGQEPASQVDLAKAQADFLAAFTDYTGSSLQ
jgi:hypothetical protein